MKRINSIVVTLILVCTCLTSCKSSVVDVNALKIQADTMMNKLSAIETANVSMKNDLSLMRTSIGQLDLKIGQVNTNMSAQLSAINNSKNESTSVGGNQQIINDKKIFELQQQANAANAKT